MKSGSRRRRTRGGAVGDALLTLAALGGLLCIVLVILAFAANISLIMFKTGSMSPTIPAGSLAVVQKIPAADISVGDVLTVDRPGSLPVTHRVTSVSGDGETRTITMRGDANDYEDPSPYTVGDARRVVFAVPGLASVVVWFSNPWVLGGLTLATSALVTWAFWPRDPRGSREPQPHRPSEPRRPNEPHRPSEPQPHRPREQRAERPRRRDGRHGGGRRSSAALAVALSAAVLSTPHAPPAHAAPSEEVVRGEHLRLVSIRDTEAMRAMAPGEPVLWQLGAALDGEERGEIEMALSAEGSPELGLQLEMRACSARWVGGACPGTEAAVSGQGPVDVGGGFVPLVSMEREFWLLISATVPENATGEVELVVRATAQGEEISVGPDPVAPLPDTGGSGPGWAVLLGAGAVLLGIAAAGARRFGARWFRAVAAGRGDRSGAEVTG